MRKQMPHNVSKRIAFLTNKLELAYGDYAVYTEVLDELHTFVINEAQSFKPRRVYKKKPAHSSLDQATTDGDDE